MTKQCLDCGCNVSNRGNRACRCENCQKKYRLQYYKNDYNNKRRANPEYREHERIEQAKRYEKQKAIMYNLKINGCAICGYNNCRTALSFHHSNPKDKLFTIGLGIHRSNEKLTKELNKCILLCANCHREIEEMER